MKPLIDKLLTVLDMHIVETVQNAPHEYSVCGRFRFGRHEVSFVIDREECDIEVYDTELDIILENVSIFLENYCIRWQDIDIESSDEWNDHGFRDEADYYNWRYR